MISAVRGRWIQTLLAFFLVGGVLTGCTVYQTGPGVYASVPPTGFDRSWNATVGALGDQGVQITSEDRSTGTVRGRRGGIEVTANVRTPADGRRTRRVRHQRHDGARIPELINRISRSYDLRMGH